MMRFIFVVLVCCHAVAFGVSKKNAGVSFQYDNFYITQTLPVDVVGGIARDIQAPDGKVKIKYKTIDGTAKAGVDYAKRLGYVKLVSGQASSPFVFSTQVSPGTSGLYFYVQLLPFIKGNDPATLELNKSRVVRVDIREDQCQIGEQAAVEFETNDHQTTVGQPLSIALVRTGNLAITSRVVLKSSDITTTAGLHYWPIDTVVEFQPMQDRVVYEDFGAFGDSVGLSYQIELLNTGGCTDGNDTLTINIVN